MGIVEYKSLNIGYCHWFVSWEGPTISSNYSPQSLWCDLVFPRWAIGSRAGRGKHWSVTSDLVSMIWSRKDIYVVRFCCVRIKPGFRPLIWLPEFTRLSKCPIVQMKCVLFHVVFFKYFVPSRKMFWPFITSVQDIRVEVFRPLDMLKYKHVLEREQLPTQ